MTRAKFECIKAANGGEVLLQAVVGGSDENDSFFEATPSGNIALYIVNKDVVFEEGQEYYVDFTKI